MEGRPVAALDTPALLIDLNRLEANIHQMMEQAHAWGLSLRPHCKTHKIPAIAHLQCAAGAVGITVAKLGEAEVMAEAGIRDIFVANQIVGAAKVERLLALYRRTRLSVGLDDPRQAELLNEAFLQEPEPIDVWIEVDTGQRRTGVLPGEPAVALSLVVARYPKLRLRGIYTHEGHDYWVPDHAALAEAATNAQQVMVETASAIEAMLGARCAVSMGSTPSVINGMFRDGIDELRPGTYVYYDASMANVLGHTEWCAATVLATVVNRPAPGRAVVDAGGKVLSVDRRPAGTILHTPGYGLIVGHPTAILTSLSDEHGVIGEGGDAFAIGDRIRIIPNHICPVSNLHDRVYGIRDDIVEVVWQVAARGRTQ